MKKATWLLCLVVLVFSAGTVLAQSSNFRPGRGHQGSTKMHKKMQHENPFRFFSWDDIKENREKLNLSDEQSAELRQLHHEFRLAQVDRRAAIEKAQIRLNALKMDRSADENEVMTAIDNLAMAKAEQEKAGYRFHMQLRSVLRDDQLEKWHEMMQDHRKDFRHHFRGMSMGRSGWFGQFDDDDWDEDDWGDDGWGDDDNDDDD